MHKVLKYVALAIVVAWSTESLSAETAKLVIYGGGSRITSGTEILAKYGRNPTNAQLEQATVEMKAARVTLHSHEKMQLTVLRTTGPGAPRDITRSPNVIYSSNEPWLVSVNSTGLISVEPDRHFKSSVTLDNETRDMVQITVIYGDKSGMSGANAIFLKIPN